VLFKFLHYYYFVNTLFTHTLCAHTTFNQGFSQFSEVFFRDMFLEDSVRISRQCCQIPSIHPDDVIFRPDANQSSNILPDDVIYRLDAHLSNTSSVQTTRTFYPDLPLCWEASNCSSLHSSGCFSSTFRRHSVFDQLWISFQSTDMGRSLQPSGRCGFHPDALIHKASCTFKIQTSGR
jgi:hypothetical protein